MKRKVKSGFTLIELMIVVIIVAILAVVLLPMFKVYVNQAIYASNAVPVIADFRTKLDLYRTQYDELPGGNYTNYIQTWSYDTNWVIKLIHGGTGAELGSFDVSSTCFMELNMSAMDFTGRQLAPSDIQYICTKSSGADYCYAIGAFGSGIGARPDVKAKLPVGCGYAVMEWQVSSLKERGAKVFERYAPHSTKLQFRTTDALTDTKDESVVIVPAWNLLEGGIKNVEDQLKGWK